MSIKRATLLDKRRAKKIQKSRTRKLKTERKRLKEMKLAKNSGLEIREGKTYESEIGMNEQNVDEIEIPGPPEIKEFTDNILTAPILIFDLETTGLQRTSDIIQIAAFSQNNKFSSYIMLNRAISNGASEVTKISVIGSQMYYNLQAVPSKLQNEAFTDFNDFVKSFLVKPLLVGHNIKCYDCHVLYNSLRFHNMWNDFASNISGFLDTLELFKLLYPKRPSYSQTALVHELLDLPTDYILITKEMAALMGRRFLESNLIVDVEIYEEHDQDNRLDLGTSLDTTNYPQLSIMENEQNNRKGDNSSTNSDATPSDTYPKTQYQVHGKTLVSPVQLPRTGKQKL
ncbi:Hypothetical predicted protein [Mytilus galloprovincialis]|nr:Hypothetical predicted protein [Mytilus galloprovincialis]